MVAQIEIRTAGKGLVEFTVGQQPGVGSYLAAMEFELQTTVEIDPQMRLLGVTRRVKRACPVSVSVLH